MSGLTEVTPDRCDMLFLVRTAVLGVDNFNCPHVRGLREASQPPHASGFADRPLPEVFGRNCRMSEHRSPPPLAWPRRDHGRCM